MAKELFFESIDSEYCHPKEYFREEIEAGGRLLVCKAVPEVGEPVGWCQKFSHGVERHSGECGKGCPGYNPTNGKNGKCRYLGYNYTPGENVYLAIGTTGRIFKTVKPNY